MKIYLAGSCSTEHRIMMRGIVSSLRSAGYEVYCPYELKVPDAWSYSQEEWSYKVFSADLKAMDEADVVVVISKGRISSAGTNFEQGYAYAKGKRVLVFQFTGGSTSLMTYCGCDNFKGVSNEPIANAVLLSLRGEDVKGPCETVLT
jgi:nucleoside 2-deoxyribosyltransferase